MVPLYIFYNGGRPRFPMGPCGGGRSLKARGTTVSGADHIAGLAAHASDVSLADVQRQAIPWECLASCPMGRQNRRTLADQIAGVLAAYGLSSPQAARAASTDDLDDRTRRLFELLGRLGAVDAPDGADRTRREMIALANEDAPAPATILLDAAGASDLR